MSVFSAPKVGSAEAIGSRYGDISGTSTDIIYPVSKLVNDQFQEGRTIEFNWKSDKHRHWHPRSTRLVHEFEFKFGEVDETCADQVAGPAPSTGVRPSKSVRFTALPGHAIYGNGQARFVQNSVVLENQNHLYDAAMVQLLTTQNQEGPSTSGSNMLTSLRKDTGLSNGILRGSQKPAASENFALLPLSPAEYAKNDEATTEYAALNGTDTLSEAMRKLRKGGDAVAGPTGLTVTTAVAKAGSTESILNRLTFKTTLSSNEDTAQAQMDALNRMRGTNPTVALGGGAKFSRFGAAVSSATLLDLVVEDPSATAPASLVVLLTVNAGKPLNGGADIAAGTTLTFTGIDPDATGAAMEVDSMTLNELAQLLTVKAKGDTYKATAPNPKAEILQMSLVNNVVTVQVSEPLMLSTMQHNYAIGPSDMSLFLTISPDWRKTLLYDHSGQYGCGADGAIVNGNESSLTGLPNTADGVLARKIYCQVKSVELHVGYVHPSEPYIPPSQSIRYSPIQVTERKVDGQSLNETFVVPPSTKSVMIFMRQDANHVCIDRELDSKAGAGINVLGQTDTAGTLDSTADRTGAQHAGTFVYDSKDIYDSRDLATDPRRVKTASHSAVETTRPSALQSLQVQLGGQIQPREMLTEMDPRNGKMSRAWNLYTQFIGRSMGYRGSVMSYAEFCGHHNANYASGPGCGDRGSFYLFDMQQPPGSLATDLQVRGSFVSNINPNAKQRIVVVAISDSIMNIGWQAPSETPVLTQVAPIIG